MCEGGALPRESGAQTACRWGWGGDFCIVEARCRKSMIFCTQYESEGWYTRIDPNPESDSPVSEAIMDRIIHNAYEVLVDGRVSMRERKGLKAAREGGGQDT